MNLWLILILLATAGLAPNPQQSPTAEPAADSLGILGLPPAPAATGKDLFAGFS